MAYVSLLGLIKQTTWNKIASVFSFCNTFVEKFSRLFIILTSLAEKLFYIVDFYTWNSSIVYIFPLAPRILEQLFQGGGDHLGLVHIVWFFGETNFEFFSIDRMLSRAKTVYRIQGDVGEQKLINGAVVNITASLLIDPHKVWTFL